MIKKKYECITNDKDCDDNDKKTHIPRMIKKDMNASWTQRKIKRCNLFVISLIDCTGRLSIKCTTGI